jgi:hypothetical protein
MGWALCVDGLKVSKVVDTLSQQWLSDSEAATKIRGWTRLASNN